MPGLCRWSAAGSNIVLRLTKETTIEPVSEGDIPEFTTIVTQLAKIETPHKVRTYKGHSCMAMPGLLSNEHIKEVISAPVLQCTRCAMITVAGWLDGLPITSITWSIAAGISELGLQFCILKVTPISCFTTATDQLRYWQLQHADIQVAVVHHTEALNLTARTSLRAAPHGTCRGRMAGVSLQTGNQVRTCGAPPCQGGRCKWRSVGCFLERC